jgi:hypothetical protein
MRSELVFRANAIIENKYQLCQTAARASRLLHVPFGDMSSTINDALIRVAALGVPPGAPAKTSA